MLSAKPTCDDCGKTLTAEEIERNTAENEDQGGNSYWCAKCAAEHAALEAEARAQCEHDAECEHR